MRKDKTSRYLNMKKGKVFEEEQDIAVFQYEERKGFEEEQDIAVFQYEERKLCLKKPSQEHDKHLTCFSVTFTWPTSKYKVGLPNSSKRTSSDVLTMYPL